MGRTQAQLAVADARSRAPVAVREPARQRLRRPVAPRLPVVHVDRRVPARAHGAPPPGVRARRTRHPALRGVPDQPRELPAQAGARRHRAHRVPAVPRAVRRLPLARRPRAPHAVEDPARCRRCCSAPRSSGGVWWVYPVFWLLPFLTVWRVINRLRSIAEHGGMDASTDRRATTHTVRQSWWARTVLVPFHIGWHLAHHVDAGVSMRHLPEYHRALSGCRATSRRASSTRATRRCGERCRARNTRISALRVRKVEGVERWFQNTRGLVIVVLAIIDVRVAARDRTGRRLPHGGQRVVGRRRGRRSPPPSTTPPSVTTTTTFARPTLQEGTADTANTMVLQQRLNALGYDVGTPDGDFGPGTRGAGRRVPDRQGHLAGRTAWSNQATWNALLAEPSTTTTTDDHDQSPDAATPPSRAPGSSGVCVTAVPPRVS